MRIEIHQAEGVIGRLTHVNVSTIKQADYAINAIAAKFRAEHPNRRIGYWKTDVVIIDCDGPGCVRREHRFRVDVSEFTRGLFQAAEDYRHFAEAEAV